MTEYGALLDRNAKALESLSDYIPRRKFVDIVASAKFPSMELALAARKFAVSRIEERDGNAANAVCTIKLTPDENGYHKSQIAVFAVPTAKIVTDAEMVIREACEQFGGVGPGWDILLPSSEWLKKQV